MSDEDFYDAEYARIWKQFPMPQLSRTDIEAERAGCRRYFGQVAARSGHTRDGVVVEDIAVPSRIDAGSVPVRLYRPAAAERPSALVYMHGGGFCVGDLDMEDERCCRMAREAQCMVASVDYRLVPEHRYPVPLEDCYSALTWIAGNAATLSIDDERLAVGGCSAGGALAAGLAQLARDRGGPRIAMQLLLYAVLDASVSNDAMRRLDDETRGHVKAMWERYVGGPRPTPPPYASPQSAQHLSGLPPAYVVSAEFDMYRDEAVAYTQGLWNAGVRAELHVWPGVPHAFDLFVPEAAVSRQSLKEQGDALVRFMGQAGTAAVGTAAVGTPVIDD